MFITIQKNLGSSRHYHPRIFITTQTIWGVVDITIQEFSITSKIIFWWFKSVENEQDFEFLAGMLLLRRVNGSSSFCKGPRTSKVWKSKDPKSKKLLLPLTLRSNNIPAKNSKSCSFSTLLNYQNMILDGNENYWVVMSYFYRKTWGN